MNWQPISTADTDDPILTNDGIVRRRTWHPTPWSPARPYWAACDYDGEMFTCRENGPFEMYPAFWMPLPPRPDCS